MRNGLLFFISLCAFVSCFNNAIPVDKLEKKSIRFLNRKATDKLRKAQVVFTFRYPISEAIYVWHYTGEKRYLDIYSRGKRIFSNTSSSNWNFVVNEEFITDMKELDSCNLTSDQMLRIYYYLGNKEKESITFFTSPECINNFSNSNDFMTNISRELNEVLIANFVEKLF